MTILICVYCVNNELNSINIINQSTYHKSPPELVGLPDLCDDKWVEDDDEKVWDDLDEKKLRPEDVVGHVGRVAPQVAGKDLVGVVDQLKKMFIKKIMHVQWNGQANSQKRKHYPYYVQIFFLAGSTTGLNLIKYQCQISVGS